MREGGLTAVRSEGGSRGRRGVHAVVPHPPTSPPVSSSGTALPGP